MRTMAVDGKTWITQIHQTCAKFILLLIAQKVFTFENKRKKVCFFFLFCLLIRTFALANGTAP